MDIKEVMKLGNANKEYMANGKKFKVINKIALVGRNIVELVDEQGEAVEINRHLFDILQWDFEEVVDWLKTPIDAPIIVKDTKYSNWVKMHFAKYENGYVYAWKNGKTSFTVECDEECIEWAYAKLI